MEFSGSFLSRCGRNVPGNMSGIIDAMILCQGAGGATIENLYIVYKECQDWKKKHVNGLFASKQNQKEEAAVSHLKGEVIDDLNAIENGLGTALEDYQGRKVHGGTKGKSFSSLGKGYDFERKTYVAGGKQQKPFSGSRIKELAEDQGLNFHKMKTRDWEQLSQGQTVRMYWLNKAQRLKLLASCVDQSPQGHRWVNIAGQHMQTSTDANDHIACETALQMYAMDRYGNLFVDYTSAGHGHHVMGLTANVARAAVASRGVTNHSSFCAGREVICAGCIFFHKGQLIHFDNDSGHYAPSRQALYKALEIIRDAGACLDYLRVGYSTANAKQFFRAATFLANGNVPDWPNQDIGWAQDHSPLYNAIPTFIQ